MTIYTTPSIKRRLACMVYEALLLFGVVFISGLLFDTMTQTRNAQTMLPLRQLWLFLIIGAYFIFFWCRSGQTLALKTWRIRVVGADQLALTVPRALLRYLLAWMWFLPAMVVDFAFSLKGWPSIAVIGGGMLLWLATVALDPKRQFLHDRLAGSLLVDAPMPAPR